MCDQPQGESVTNMSILKVFLKHVDDIRAGIWPLATIFALKVTGFNAPT